MSAETAVSKKIWLALTNICTLFRLNTGQAYVGLGKPNRLSDGSVLLTAARPVALGFAYPNGKTVVGAADLIGWTSQTVTQDMVGRKIAVFTSVEAKRTSGGRISSEQLTWQSNVIAAGGVAIIANSEQDALLQMENYFARR